MSPAALANVPTTDALHPESLLHIPLVRQMLEDEHVPRRARAVDRRWTYERVVPVSMTGFNPYQEAIYYGSQSAFARWLADPAASARDQNEGDFLVHEVFFAVHDYLHVWTVQLLRELLPGRNLGRGRLDAKDLEAFTFLHLVTEAAATVGLDYWYLSTIDVNQVVPIGTCHNLLASDYRESDLPELRRANPTFEVQTPAFFTELTRFYCTGVLHGFDVDDLRRSPRTHKWLRHELSYGALQRRYVRQWLRYLASGEITRGDRRDSAPVAVDEPWQERILAEVGEALWRKVTLGAADGFTRGARGGGGVGGGGGGGGGRGGGGAGGGGGVGGAGGAGGARELPWAAPSRAVPDFRFTNLNALDGGGGGGGVSLEALATGPGGEENEAFFAYQLLSQYSYAGVDPELRRILADLASRRGGVATMSRLCRELTPVPAEPDEPRDLLLLN
jgi:hypothetical protein